MSDCAEEAPFGSPDVSLCIEDEVSLWCSLGSSVCLVGVRGPGFGSTQPISSIANKQDTASRAEKLVARSPLTFAAAFRAFLVRIFIRTATKRPILLLCASAEQPMVNKH